MKFHSLLILVFCILLTFTGCFGVSNYSGVRWPNIVIDGAGNAIAVYQVNEGDKRVTYAQKLGADGEALWDGKGTALYSEPGASEGGGITASLINSNEGKTIIIWENQTGTHAQKLDQFGQLLWNENTPAFNGTYSTNAIGDNSGGFIAASSSDDFYFQHIDSNGDIKWETTSMIGSGQFLRFTVDSSGNTFIVWEDIDFNIFIQKLDVEGHQSWIPGGILLCTNGTGDGMQAIIDDGVGGAIIAWINGVPGEEKGSITGTELYIQRVNAKGQAVWRENGVPVITAAQTQATFMPVEPQLVKDGSGGAFLVWRGSMSIFAQRISALGELLFSGGGITIWNGEGSPISPLFSIITDAADGFIVVWNYIEEGKKLTDSPSLGIQRYDSNGNKLWGEDGILVTKESPGYITPMVITNDGNDGVFIAWAAGENIHNASLSYVQRLSTDGSFLWGENGILLK